MASESCSSTENNGCSSCGPSLFLFSIGASTSQDMVGKGCFNGDNPSPKKVFFSESSNASFNYNASDNIIDLSITDTASYNYNENIRCFTDRYGVIICTSTLSSSNSYNDFYSDELDPGHTSAGSISCSKSARKSSCEPEPETKCNLGGNCAINEMGCPGGPEGWNCLQEECNESLSCTSRTRSGSLNESISGGGPNGNLFAQSNGTYSFRRTISSIKSLSYFYDLCQSSASTKIDILTNNESRNCDGTKCGDGGKDDCWGGTGPFEIADNNLDDPNATSTTSQKWKFKIGTSKEEFNKEYKSVSGKIYFYYDGGGKTPCCDEDFDGTVVKEQGYSISAGSTFKNEYFAPDAGDFDNDDQSLVGKTINICYTIDNVSFI